MYDIATLHSYLHIPNFYLDEQGNVKKKRKMRAKDVWTLPASEKIKVECNQFGQPIKKAGGILGGWLGTVARRGNMCPIHYISWKIMPIDPFKLKIINVTRVSCSPFIELSFV